MLLTLVCVHLCDHGLYPTPASYSGQRQLVPASGTRGFCCPQAPMEEGLARPSRPRVAYFRTPAISSVEPEARPEGVEMTVAEDIGLRRVCPTAGSVQCPRSQGRTVSRVPLIPTVTFRLNTHPHCPVLFAGPLRAGLLPLDCLTRVPVSPRSREIVWTREIHVKYT